MMMHHHTKFNYKRLSGSEDVVWTKYQHTDGHTDSNIYNIPLLNFVTGDGVVWWDLHLYHHSQPCHCTLWYTRTIFIIKLASPPSKSPYSVDLINDHHTYISIITANHLPVGHLVTQTVTGLIGVRLPVVHLQLPCKIIHPLHHHLWGRGSLLCCCCCRLLCCRLLLLLLLQLLLLCQGCCFGCLPAHRNGPWTYLPTLQISRNFSGLNI